MSRTTCTVCGNPSLSCCCGNWTATAPGCSSSAPIPCSQALPCSSCPEDHTKTIINATYAASVRIQNSWNVPDCGNNTVLTIPGLSQITVGAYLWNPSYGYFQVTAFNSTLQQVTIVNNCTEGNATAGTKVPACTDFNLSPPPCTCNNAQPDLFPYVALDFTAPNDGDCTNITVTNVNGLVAGKNVEIAGGTYLLDSIVTGTVIKICNEGEGLPAGTPVIALDGAGNYQYPIILVDANPCTNPSDDTGVLVVCNGDDLQVPLESAFGGGDAPGLLVGPMLTDGSTTEVTMTPIDAGERICTELSAGLNITSGDATYTLEVADAGDFTIGDILKIEGRTEEFTVTGTGSGTIDVTADPVPGADGTVPLGHWVCLRTCCDELQALFDNTIAVGEDGNLARVDASTTTTYTSSAQSWSVSNTTERSIVNLSIIKGEVTVSPVDGEFADVDYTAELLTTIDAVPVGADLSVQMTGPTTYKQSHEIVYTRTDTIAPGSSVAFTAVIKVTSNNGETYNLTGIATGFSRLRVVA